MKLSALYEQQGHWEPIGGHPGAPGIKKKKRQMSFFVKPPKLKYDAVSSGVEKIMPMKYGTRAAVGMDERW